MPIVLDDRQPWAPRLGVYPSVALEIEWALAAATRPEYRQDNAVLARLYDQAPERGEWVRTFWSGPDEVLSCGGFSELAVLAHHGGLLFSTDADALIAQLEDLAVDAPTDLTLASESPEDRRAILTRLSRLASSADLRKRYVELIRATWADLRFDWEGEGRRAVDASIALRRSMVAKGAPWYEMARCDCDFGADLGRVVEQLEPSGELALVPCFFTHKGLFLELPGLVVIGVRTDHSGAEARARTELLARRLKTIADPTRLAILHTLGREPLTITGLARTFALAQPTVSNHVKQLRDAGLVAQAPGSPRRDLVVCTDAVADLLEHLEGVLAP